MLPIVGTRSRSILPCLSLTASTGEPRLRAQPIRSSYAHPHRSTSFAAAQRMSLACQPLSQRLNVGPFSSYDPPSKSFLLHATLVLLQAHLRNSFHVRKSSCSLTMPPQSCSSCAPTSLFAFASYSFRGIFAIHVRVLLLFSCTTMESLHIPNILERVSFAVSLVRCSAAHSAF